MNPLRRVTLPTLFLAAMTAFSSLAYAQTGDDVDKAARELAEATAASQNDTAAVTAAMTDLLGQISRYNEATTSLTRVSHQIIDLETETLAKEAELRRARDAERSAARAVYMAAFNSTGPISLTMGSVYEALITEDLLERITDHATIELGRTPAVAADLDEGRSRLAAAQRSAADLRAEAEAAVASLQRLLARNETRAALSAAAVTEAHAQLQLTIEERERRLRGLTERVTRWEDLIEKYFQPAHFWQALEVMQCESGGNPAANNRTSDASGLFQFLEGTWAFASIGAGFEGASRYDAEANIASAAWLVNHSVWISHPRGTWGHWECQPTSPEG